MYDRAADCCASARFYFIVSLVKKTTRGVMGSSGRGQRSDYLLYNAAIYTTRDHQRFTITELAADWHETLLQRIMRPSLPALANNCRHTTASSGATSRATWLMTADSSPTPVSDDCVLPTLEHWSSVAHKALLAILLRQHLGSGTVCRLKTT